MLAQFPAHFPKLAPLLRLRSHAASLLLSPDGARMSSDERARLTSRAHVLTPVRACWLAVRTSVQHSGRVHERLMAASALEPSLLRQLG